MKLGGKVYVVVGRRVEEREIVGESPSHWFIGWQPIKPYAKAYFPPRGMYLNRDLAEWNAGRGMLIRMRSLLWGN